MKTINLITVLILSVFGIANNQNRSEHKIAATENELNQEHKRDTMRTEDDYIFELNAKN